MEEGMGEEYVELPFLADEEVISVSGWTRIAAAFSTVAESTNDEKRDLRIAAKVEDVCTDGYENLSNLRELNVRTLRNELQWPMLMARHTQYFNGGAIIAGEFIPNAQLMQKFPNTLESDWNTYNQTFRKEIPFLSYY